MIRGAVKLEAEWQVVLAEAFEVAGEQAGIYVDDEWHYVAFKNAGNRSTFIQHFLEHLSKRRTNLMHYIERIPPSFRIDKSSYDILEDALDFISTRLDAFLTANKEEATLDKFNDEEARYMVRQLSQYVQGHVDITQENGIVEPEP